MKKLTAFVLVWLLAVTAVFADWTVVGKNSKAETSAQFVGEAFPLESAIYWAMLIAADYDSEFYDYDIAIYSKQEFVKLDKRLFGDSATALIKQNYGLTSIASDEWEDCSVVRLEDGTFLVITITEGDE